MYSEIGILAASRIPKGVLFGSLPTRLIKSESNGDEQKFGFVEVEYTNGELVSQYGSQFNWMKYISTSSDAREQNIEAFIDESGEISFETTRGIERGQELLYAFGKQHLESDKSNVKQKGQCYGKMSKHENQQDWSTEKHNCSYDGHRNDFKPSVNRESCDSDEKDNALIEKKETSLPQLDDKKQLASRNIWFAGSFEKCLSKVTPHDQLRTDGRQLPWFSERLRMTRHQQENEMAYHETTDAESRDTKNGVKAFRQDNVNWYQVPVAVTRPLGCTCTWSQPYFPRKTYEYKAMCGSNVERRPHPDDNPHRMELSASSHHAMNLRQRRVAEEPSRTLTREKFNTENFQEFSEENGEREKIMGDTQPGDLLRRNPIPKPSDDEAKNIEVENDDHASTKGSKNVVVPPSTGSKLPEHDNKKQAQNKGSDQKQNKNMNESPKPHGSAEELASTAKSDEKCSSDHARNGSRFVCDYCGKSYCRRYVLKIHMRTHTGHKPLHCTVCWKSFGDPSNLKKHVRSHARKNAIYTCEHCGRGSFYRLCDLVRHIKFRHRLASAGKWPNNGASSSNKKQDGN